MSKKKKKIDTDEDNSNNSYFDSAVVSSMKSDYGVGFAIPLSSLEDKDRGVIKTFPSLDVALNGGLSKGQLVHIAGKPKTGKTTLALGIASSFQSSNIGKDVFYYKIEGRLSTSLASGIDGLDLKRVIVIRSTIDHIMNGAEFLDIIEKNMRTFPESMHIIDSIGAISGELEMANGMGDQQRGELAKLLAKFCRRNSNVIDVTNSLVIALNHVRTKQGYGTNGGTTSPGGNHWNHQMDTDMMLSLAYPDYKIESKDGFVIGHNIDIIVNTTTMGPPKQHATIPLVYGKGVSRFLDIINLAEQISIIEKSGAWFNFGDNKWQGRPNMYEALEKDNELFSELENTVMGFVDETS